MNDRFLAACKGNEVKDMYIDDLHLINKTLTMSSASGNTIPLKCCYFFHAFLYTLTGCINIIIIKEKQAHRKTYQMSF